jgi:predicted ATPase
VSLRDLGAVRLRDLFVAERVYQVAHADLRRDFPALRKLEATPNNLPQPVTSFVGRERELADVKRLLGTTRLLTLLGAGGIGKTRLSLQAAADLLDDYRDGVWFVELAPITDERLVPQAAASVLGVKEEAGHPLADALVKFVRDRQLLLILDNCEHLVQACAELAGRLLRAGPELKVLASSREALRVGAETTYPVPALAVPGPGDKLALDALTQYEAVRLFIDRASAMRPAFALTVGNASAVTGICRHLDGIPLAIELAAARVRSLSVENIAARLNDRFRLLTGGNRTALPRQQTLRALIDWSYDLLTQKERALFRRLAVFAGGWTIEAAEAVGADGKLGEPEVLDLLTALVEKSLVAMEPNGGRYRLLESVRQYAQERLDVSGDGDVTRTRHLASYLKLAEEARAGLAGAGQGAWLSRLDTERENLLAAHAWCDRAQGGGELGLRLAYGVQPYWIKRGVLELGHRVMADALARPGAEARNLARCKALFGAGWFDCYMGSYKEAQRHLEESQAIAREIGDKRRVAAGLQPLAMAFLGQGDLATARRHCEDALALEQELGNAHQVAAALNALAQIHRLEGDLHSAEPLFEKVMALGREMQDREMVAIALLNLAMVAIGRGSGDQARRLLLEALAIAEEIGSIPVGQSVLEVSAGLAALREEWEDTARFFGSAEARIAQTGLHRDPADEAFLVPLIARARERLGATAFANLELAARSLSYEEAMAGARGWLEQQS